MNPKHPFKWRHCQEEIILLCVKWLLTLPAQLPQFRRDDAGTGLTVDHTMVYRWVQAYAPELDKRCRPHLLKTNDSWRVDETYRV